MDAERRCCFVGDDGQCEAAAEFEIYAVGEGVNPYDNITETCVEHVGPMLGITVDEYERGHRADHWRVVPIYPVPDPDSAGEGQEVARGEEEDSGRRERIEVGT